MKGNHGNNFLTADSFPQIYVATLLGDKAKAEFSAQNLNNLLSRKRLIHVLVQAW